MLKDVEGLQVTVEHLCCWENRITKACLAVASKIIINTAKLLQMIRITNADGRYSFAPIAQMQCCAHHDHGKACFNYSIFYLQINSYLLATLDYD
jgi:hypothetical protein